MRVVLAVDGSYHSMYAVDVLASRAWTDADRIRVITAIAPAPVFAPPDLGGLMPPVMDQAQLRELNLRAEQLVDRAAGVLRGRGLRVETVVREGDPRAAILEEARTWDADLIVVGSQGLSRLKRLLIGSVASYVATHAPCSVELVRKKQPAGA